MLRWQARGFSEGQDGRPLLPAVGQPLPIVGDEPTDYLDEDTVEAPASCPPARQSETTTRAC